MREKMSRLRNNPDKSQAKAPNDNNTPGKPHSIHTHTNSFNGWYTSLANHACPLSACALK